MSALVAASEAAVAVARGTGVVLLHGTALAAVAWLLSATLLRRSRPALVAALWSVVLLKFAIPVGPALPWSLSDLLDAIFDRGGGASLAPLVTGPAAHVARAHPLGAAEIASMAALALWMIAVALIAMRRIRGQREAMALARSLPAAPRDVIATAVAVATRLGLGRVPAVRIAADGASPWVAGVRAPVVVVPAALAARADELAAALAHELAHLRRRDAWLRVVQVAVGAVFFFWPVVRWVNRRIDSAREMACDAHAVALGPLPARDYARLLVRLARAGSAVVNGDRGHRGRDAASAGVPADALALTAPRLLRGRVDALLAARPGKAPGIGRIGAVGLAGWTALALGGASRASADSARGEVCIFTRELATSILAAHPEADVDGDGVLTRAEACEFQSELRRRLVDELGDDPAEYELAMASPLATEPLCCNCGDGGGTSSPPTEVTFRANQPANTCVRGVDP